MCIVLLPPGGNPIAVKYIIYHIRLQNKTLRVVIQFIVILFARPNLIKTRTIIGGLTEGRLLFFFFCGAVVQLGPPQS